MSDRMGEVPDLEAPGPDALEQSVPVGDPAEERPPVEELSSDPEVPVPDAIEQRQPAPVFEDDDYR
jgi:hypothetical protein